VVLAAENAAAADATANWANNCAFCHGNDGSGNTAVGRRIGVVNLTDSKAQANFTDKEAINAIKEGKGKMKAFKDKLSDEEIKALVAHVRAFKNRLPSSPRRSWMPINVE